MSEMLHFASCLHIWEYRLSEFVSLQACWFYYGDIANLRNRILIYVDQLEIKHALVSQHAGEEVIKFQAIQAPLLSCKQVQ